MMFDTNPNI